VAPHRVQNLEWEDSAVFPQTGQTGFASGAPHTSQNWAFLSETMAPQAGQTGNPCGVTGSSLSGAPHRSQNRELLSGAGAPQFPHFLVMYFLVNNYGSGIKTAVLCAGWFFLQHMGPRGFER
jgi:hypothetical protein